MIIQEEYIIQTFRWNTFTINILKIYFLTSAEEDRIMEQVFKEKNIRINQDLLWVNQPKNNRGGAGKPKWP